MASRRPQLTIAGLHLPAPDLDEHALRTALSVWSWGVFGVVVLGGLAVQLPLALLTRPFDRNRALAGRLARIIGVIFAKLNPLWDFAVAGQIGDYRPRRTVVISNHTSNADVFAIVHLPWEMKWLGKRSVFFIPVLGWLMWLAGDIPVKRGVKGSVKQAMAICRRYLERGMPVIIFPEGTRSAAGELLPFKDGAFRLAIEAEAEVLPLCVAGTRDALPKHSWRFGFSRGRVTVGEPISTAGLTLADLPALKARARQQMEALLATM